MIDYANKNYLRRGRIARLILAWLKSQATKRCPEADPLKHGVQFRIEDGLTFVEPARQRHRPISFPGTTKERVMYYVMVLTGTCPTRHGRMFKPGPQGSLPPAAVRLAEKVGGYVEKYGHGVVWTPKVRTH